MTDTLDPTAPAWQQRMGSALAEAEAEAEQARAAWMATGTPEAGAAFARTALRAAVWRGLARDLEDVAAGTGAGADRTAALRRACRRGMAGAPHP